MNEGMACHKIYAPRETELNKHNDTLQDMTSYDTVTYSQYRYK